MAAQDYYQQGGGAMPQAPQQAPRPQQHYTPQPQQSTSNLPYPISDAPPPYSLFSEQNRPQSQPPPQNRPQNHVNFAPTNNYPPAQNGGYAPEKQGYRPSGLQNGHNAYPPQQQYGGSYPNSQQPSPYPPQQSSQQGYPFPNGLQPPPAQGYSDHSRRSSAPGYPPAVSPYRDDNGYDDRSRSRSRSRGGGGRRHHHHHHDPPPQQKKKGKGVGTFLGAGGGAIIGDAIFPGLGTLGGAILGGVGGHEYSKQRRSYSNPSQYGRSKSYHGRDYENDDGMDARGRRRNVY